MSVVFHASVSRWHRGVNFAEIGGRLPLIPKMDSMPSNPPPFKLGNKPSSGGATVFRARSQRAIGNGTVTRSATRSRSGVLRTKQSHQLGFLIFELPIFFLHFISCHVVSAPVLMFISSRGHGRGAVPGSPAQGV